MGGCAGLLTKRLLDVVVEDYEGDLISDRQGQNGELDASVGDDQANDAEEEIDGETDGVFDTEGVEVGRPFERGVDVVEAESGGEQAEEPAAAGEEILLVAAVLGDIVGEEKLREQKVENGVEDDEEVGLEVPGADGGEPELPPPEVGDPEQDGSGPAEVQDGGAFAAGMLDEAGKAGEQRGDAQTNDDGDDDPDVEVDVREGGSGSHLVGMILPPVSTSGSGVKVYVRGRGWGLVYLAS